MDGILFGNLIYLLVDELRNIKLFLNISEEKDIFKLMKKILLVPDYEKPVYEAAFRITSILLSEFNDSTHIQTKV